MLSQSISGRVGAKRVLQLMYECDAFVAKGPYKPGPRSFTGRMSASYGSFSLAASWPKDRLAAGHLDEKGPPTPHGRLCLHTAVAGSVATLARLQDWRVKTASLP